MWRTLNLFLAYVILVSLQGECLGEAKNLRTLTLKRRKYLGKSSLSLEESLLSFFFGIIFWSPQSSCSPMSVSLDPFLFGMKHCAIESRLWGLPFFRFFWRSETYEHLAWCPIRQTTSIKYFMSLNTIDLQKGCWLVDCETWFHISLAKGCIHPT